MHHEVQCDQKDTYQVSVLIPPQDTLGIPRTVALDLSADRIDMEQPLPALVVAEVDSLAVPELALEDDQTRYLCLSSDNRQATPSLV